MKLPQPPPAGWRYREDTSPDAASSLPDPTEAWRPVARPGDPDALKAFKRTGGALPRRMWHMLFVVAAHRLGAWAGRRELEALHEDWAVLMSWWHHRPSDGAEQRAFMTAALEELLARPQPRPARGTKRRTSITPRMLLVKYDFCRREVATIQNGLAPPRPAQRQNDEWRRRLNDLAEEVALYPLDQELRQHMRTTIKGDAGRTVLTKKQQARLDRIEHNLSPSDTALAVLDCLYDLAPEYLRRKVLPQARRGGAVLTSWMAAE